MFNPPPRREPRASRIPIHRRAAPRTELWMGGADSLHGDLVLPEDLADAWVVDLAGDMPEEHRAACSRWLPRVFADMEEAPHDYARLITLAASIAACMTGIDSDGGWPHSSPLPGIDHGQCRIESHPGAGGVRLSEWQHPATPPVRVYVMCQQGLNRSGLFMGLLLRALGVSAADAVSAIASRPGALNNQTFVRLIYAWPDMTPADGS